MTAAPEGGAGFEYHNGLDWWCLGLGSRAP